MENDSKLAILGAEDLESISGGSGEAPPDAPKPLYEIRNKVYLKLKTDNICYV